MNEKQSYKGKINKIEELIHKYIRFGFFCFKPLGGKEIKIKEFSISDKNQTITFILETKFKEIYDYPVLIDNLDKFLNNLQPCNNRQVVIRQEQKSINYCTEQMTFGFTKDYTKFKIMKKSISKYPIPKIMESMEKFGNMIPIVVFKKQDKFIILDGKKRFNILMEKGQDIFYINVTPLIKVEINECFVTDSNIAINQPKIYQIWGDLCKYYYPDYKKVDDFIKQVKIEKYISKWKFLHLLEPKWDIILSGEANLKDYQKLYEMILEFMSKIQENEIFDLYKYLKNNYKPLEKDKKTGEVKTPWYFKYLVWTDINSVEYSDVELVNEKVGFYKIKLYESKNFGYNINLVKDERPEFNFLTRQCELILYIDHPQRFLEDNNLLFQAILDSPIFIDLKDILNEVIKEREIIYNLIEENKQFFI